MICIWCKTKHNNNSVEHIIPESLGCPDNFTLSNGEVCQKCNNRLGNVDKALLHDLEMVAFQNNIPRKKGKPPKVNSIPNIRGEYVDGKPVFHMNMDPHAIEMPDGRALSGYRKNSSAIDVKMNVDKHIAKTSFQIEFGKNKKFNRAITKIAFSSVAYFLGPEAALSDKYDHIREYVLYGGSIRPIILTAGKEHTYRHEVAPPYTSQHDGYYFSVLVIAGITFMVDLSPTLNGLRDMFEQLKSAKIPDNQLGILPYDWSFSDNSKQ